MDRGPPSRGIAERSGRGGPDRKRGPVLPRVSATPRGAVSAAMPLVSTAPVPSVGGLPTLRRAAAGCRSCDLWKLGTQTVFGEGAHRAELFFVGEQPGDEEDRAGRPF